MFTTTGTGYTNTSAKAGYTYFYKVKAIREDGFVESSIISVKCKQYSLNEDESIPGRYGRVSEYLVASVAKDEWRKGYEYQLV